VGTDDAGSEPETAGEVATPEPEPTRQKGWTGDLKRQFIESKRAEKERNQREDETTDRVISLLEKQNKQAREDAERFRKMVFMLLASLVMMAALAALAMIGVGRGTIELPFGLGSVSTAPVQASDEGEAPEGEPAEQTPGRPPGQP